MDVPNTLYLNRRRGIDMLDSVEPTSVGRVLRHHGEPDGAWPPTCGQFMVNPPTGCAAS